ncbi:glycosyltransferase family 4 protein [Bacillus sp. SCS-153A]|uniref:glycosyltransferase family 4 protein n=1 Tax=Rossellomorea sedimentorum TaxID=3115294 RepID=UPI00390698F1
MKKVYVANKSRGFLTRLFNTKFDNIHFINENRKVYDTKSNLRIILFEIVKSRLADHLGVIQRIKANNENANFAFSYNRFLESDNKYVIYLENPLALVHYSTGRNKTLLGRAKLKKYLNDPNLMSIVCLSKACYETLHSFYEIPSQVNIEQIYPLIESNELVSTEKIHLKSHNSDIQCLYISSNFNLKGGKDIIDCFKRLKNQGKNNIKLKIITQKESLDDSVKNEINQNKNISLFDFNFNKEELNEIYSESCILLNPSRQDSFSLVVLEAMKAGNTILTTDLYAIPEMVSNDYNGYLTSPKFRYFNYDNLPNLEVWRNRKGTIHSDYIDDNIVNFLYEKLSYLENNRNELERLSLNSYEKANSGKFSEEYIKEKWNGIFNDIQ